MPSYIAIQNTYDIFEMALFLNDICVDHIQEDKRHTSKVFIPLLEKLLVQNSTKITDLDFCAVNCGPGPFSTLRSIIASVNGLHAAINIPLIGIDGLEATFLEMYDPQYENTVVLLNAFNREVYYLIAHKGQITGKGYQKIDVLLNGLSNFPIHFIGNGVTLYHLPIKEKIGNNAIIKEGSPEICSVQMIGALGIEKWRHNYKGDQPDEATAKTGLMPLYLKKHAVEL